MFKSLALTISKCTSTVILLFMISYNTEVEGLNVTLDPNGVGSVSGCSSDQFLTAGDFYIFRGIVDATNVIIVANFIDFQIKTTSDIDFKTLCSVSLITCVTPNSQPCYCAEQNGDIYHIVANRSAIVSYSNAEIRILWKNSPDVLSNNKLTLPKIIDVSNVTTSYTLDDATMSCPATVTNGSVIKYQCLNSPSPCDLTITVNNTDVVKGEHNVTYTVSTNLTLNTKYIFTFSSSVCGRSKQPILCPVIREDVITTSPTSSTAVTNGTTSTNTGTTVSVPTTNSTTAPLGQKSGCTLSCKDWGIALSVIFYVAILVIISTGITILVEVGKKKKQDTSIKKDKKTVAFYLCIGFLVFAEILDIILIIVFAQADPCKCDPEPGIELALWEIMLIIFCIVNGLLIIATLGVLIWIFVFEENKQVPESNSPEVTTATTANTPNTRNPNIDKNKNGQK